MNHDGSLGNAIRMAEVAAECGADAVKFQLHDAEAETTRDAPSPPYFEHETRWEYFERTAFTDEQWATLKAACEAAGDRVPLLRVLARGGRAARARSASSRYKIGSGEVTNLELVRAAAATGKPVLLTSGMSLVGRARRRRRGGRRPRDGAPVHVAVPDAARARRPERARASCASATASRSASPTTRSGTTRRSPRSTLGATVVEKHFTLSRDLYGAGRALRDSSRYELEDLVDGIRELETMLANPVDKDDLEPFGEMKQVFEKSVVVDAGDSRPAPRSPARWWRPRSRARAFRRACSPRSSAGRRASTSPADTVITEDLLA